MLSDGGPHAPNEAVPAEPGCGVQIRNMLRSFPFGSGVFVPGSTAVIRSAKTPVLANSPDSGPRTSTAETLVKAFIEFRIGVWLVPDTPDGTRRSRTSWLAFRKFAKN